MKEPEASRKKRARDIIRLLRRSYPNARTELNHRNPLELLIATILSAQCTDKKVNEITGSLFKKYTDVNAFARADQSVLEQEIKPTGFYRNKAAHIIAAANRIRTAYRGRVPKSMEALVTLPGVARKTANIVLAGAFHTAEGIAVDTHVKRLAGRMGLTTNTTPDKIEQDLMALLPKSFWLDTNFVLVNHGRETCPARKPRCALCVVSHVCPTSTSMAAANG